jgi:hypothetical protein
LAYAHLSHDEIQRRLYQYKRVSVYFRLRSKLGAARPIRFGVQPLQPLMDDHPRDGCSLREMDTRTHIPHQEHTLHTLVASSNPFSPVVPDTLRSSFHDKYFQDLVEGGNYADIFTTAGTTRRLLSTSESSASTTDATTPVSSASTNPHSPLVRPIWVTGTAHHTPLAENQGLLPSLATCAPVLGWWMGSVPHLDRTRVFPASGTTASI